MPWTTPLEANRNRTFLTEVMNIYIKITEPDLQIRYSFYPTWQGIVFDNQTFENAHESSDTFEILELLNNAGFDDNCSLNIGHDNICS